MKTKKLLLTFAVLFIALISGCAKDDFEEIQGLCPVVDLTSPLPDATNIPLDQVITANFNEEMNPETINQSSFTLNGSSEVAGVVTYSGTTATFSPSALLSPNTTYTARITTAAKDLTGNAIQADHVWTFTTGATVRPTVILTSPFDDATAVDLNKTVTADFSMEMDPTTLNKTTFTLFQGTNQIAGVVSYGANRASFNPNLPLDPNLKYTATITTAAKSSTGIALANDYVWNFTTGNVATPAPVISSGLFFGIFGGNAGVTNQGLLTVVNGAIGTTAASTLITGFTDGTNGDTYTITGSNNGVVTDGIFTDAPAPGNITKAAAALEGLNAATDLYNSISPASMPGGVVNPGAGELGGLTLEPGIYVATSSFNITNGDLVLDAKGNPDAKWYFQAPSTLTVGDSAPSSVKFLNGVGNPNNVYWYVGSAAVINYAGGGVMVGNIIANSGVTLSSPANATNPLLTVLNGRAISLVASVTMVNTVINVPN